MKTLKQTLVALAFFGLVGVASAHCQIPCGIYDDDARFNEMAEHVTTIRKSINQINELSKAEKKNLNQIVRWVNNKEEHADKISVIVHKYFLAQRIKSTQNHYTEKLVALHNIIVLSMKAKQGTSLATVDNLEKAIKTFQDLYSHKH